MSITALLITISILLIVGAISKAIMDIVDFKFNQSIFSKIKSEKWRMWFNQDKGWKNKWKNRDPKQGPAFPGSTTVLVFVTDAWHFFQMVMLTCFQISITLPIAIIIGGNIFSYVVILTLIFKVAFGSTFELFFEHLFKKKP